MPCRPRCQRLASPPVLLSLRLPPLARGCSGRGTPLRGLREFPQSSPSQPQKGG